MDQAAPSGGSLRGLRGPGWRAAAVVAAIAALAALLAAVTFDGLRGAAADGLLRARDAGRPVPERVVVVEVDRSIVAREGLPLPRSVYARAIRRLDAAGARVIAVDVQFTEPSPPGLEDQDEALLAAIEEVRTPVVLATSQVVDAPRQTDVLGGTPNLEPAGAVAAHSSLPLAGDGRWRAIEPSRDGLATFVQASSVAAGGPAVPADGAPLDPTVPASRLHRERITDLLAGRVPRDAVAGRVAVIGLTQVTSSGDDRGLVAGSSGVQFGVFVQAQGIDTALRGTPLQWAPALSWLLALAMVTLSGLATLARRAWVHVAALSAGVLGLVAASVIATRAGLLADPLPALFAVFVGTVIGIAVRAASEAQRRARARASLARFVPPAIVDELLADGSDGRLAAQLQTASVVFCDLRGYTALVAGLPRPEALADVLDAYLGEVTAVIHAHGGTVVSFQGDGVMAAFGAPIASDDAPVRAVAAARALLNDALPRVAARVAELVPGAEPPALGVGIATGEVLAGTVGPPARREYAVVGGPTNLAARLQAQSKQERATVVIDRATAVACGAASTAPTGVQTSRPDLRLLGTREIRGLDKPVECWTLA